MDILSPELIVAINGLILTSAVSAAKKLSPKFHAAPAAVKQAVILVGGYVVAKIGSVFGVTLSPDVASWSTEVLTGVVTGATAVGWHEFKKLAVSVLTKLGLKK